MNNAYFRKESLRNRIIGPNKQPVQFEPVGNDIGVKVVDADADAETFKVLEDLANKRRMGVTRISAEQYESQKKSPLPPRPSAGSSHVGQSIRVFNKESVLPKPQAAAQPAVSAPTSLGIGPDVKPVENPVSGAESAKQRLFAPRTKKASAVKPASTASIPPQAIVPPTQIKDE